jgi:hypothetical protein
VDQRPDLLAVRAEFVHDATRGRLVRERDEEGLGPLGAEVLNVEHGVAGWELRKFRIRETSRQLPIAIEDVDLAAVLVGRA